MSKRIVLDIQVTNRVEKIPDVQKILIGLHEVSKKVCPQLSLIIETCGEEA
jgi:hypothetical protein